MVEELCRSHNLEPSIATVTVEWKRCRYKMASDMYQLYDKVDRGMVRELLAHTLRKWKKNNQYF